MADLYNMKTHDLPTPMISKTYFDIIQKNAERLNSAIVYDRDFNYQVEIRYCCCCFPRKRWLEPVTRAIG